MEKGNFRDGGVDYNTATGSLALLLHRPKPGLPGVPRLGVRHLPHETDFIGTRVRTGRGSITLV